MQIKVNSDRNVDTDVQLAAEVEAEVAAALERFGERLTRVEVHLGDVNAEKSGASDKRCLIEARPASHDPIAVSHTGATLEAAIAGATKKIRRTLERVLGRLDDRKGGVSIRSGTAPTRKTRRALKRVLPEA